MGRVIRRWATSVVGGGGGRGGGGRNGGRGGRGDDLEGVVRATGIMSRT